jgi:hypothetical protein
MRIPLTYADAHGVLETEIFREGDLLFITLENRRFYASLLHGFSPVDIEGLPPRFVLNEVDDLTDMRVCYRIPWKAEHVGGAFNETLTVEIDYDRVSNAFGITGHFTATLEGKLITVGWFQDMDEAYKKLETLLPPGLWVVPGKI